MINAIIFSVDRAMQLALLLDSIKKFDIDHVFSIHILYAFSSERHLKSYAQLKNQYQEVNWVQEERYIQPQPNHQFDFFYWHNLYWWIRTPNLRKNKSNFKSQLIEILSTNNHPFTMFLTDDSLFYKPITVPESCLEQIKRQPRIYSFSFRHGMNLSGGIYKEQGNHISWNIYDNDFKTDWGYPFSVDGHIYWKNMIVPVLRKIIFNNPNTLEANVCAYVRQRNLFPQVYAFSESCLIGFELNRVQQIFRNHHLDISPEILNNYFLDGYHLDIDFVKEADFQYRPQIQSIKVVKEENIIYLYQK